MFDCDVSLPAEKVQKRQRPSFRAFTGEGAWAATHRKDAVPEACTTLMVL